LASLDQLPTLESPSQQAAMLAGLAQAEESLLPALEMEGGGATAEDAGAFQGEAFQPPAGEGDSEPTAHS
ncbi:MAG: hypothetical protein ACXWVJ_09420, partial [Caulobacteraceae bacterium]